MLRQDPHISYLQHNSLTSCFNNINAIINHVLCLKKLVLLSSYSKVIWDEDGISGPRILFI